MSNDTGNQFKIDRLARDVVDLLPVDVIFLVVMMYRFMVDLVIVYCWTQRTL
jgi:hypothetical protein